MESLDLIWLNQADDTGGVTPATNALLLESGDNLLLENGDRLMLEVN